MRGSPWGAAAVKELVRGFLFGTGFFLARPVADWIAARVGG